MFYERLILSIICFIYLYPFIYKKSINLLNHDIKREFYLLNIFIMSLISFFIKFENYREFLIYIFLSYSSLTDIRYMEVKNYMITFYLFISMFFYYKTFNLNNFVFSLIFFIFLFLLSNVTSFGMGDIKAIFIIFIYLDIYNSLLVVIYTLFIFSLYSIFSIILKENNLKTKLPFIPFIYLGYLVKIFLY